jgi:polysaccharide export outer membrane protein
MIRNFVIGLFACAVLSACTIIPGSHLSVPAPENTGSDQDLSQQVDVYAITPQLVAAMVKPDSDQPIVDNGLSKQIKQYDYIVRPGDTLNITLHSHSQISSGQSQSQNVEGDAAASGYYVHHDGSIIYPYLGAVAIAGLTTKETRQKLTEKLLQYLQKPVLDVTVTNFRSSRVYITGAVGSPGILYLSNEAMTLFEAVTLAGGLSNNADWTNVTLIRDGQSIRYSLRQLYENGDSRQNVLLRPNDAIHIATDDAAKVFVLGEVGAPKTIGLGRTGLTLADALAQAGGFSQTTADASGIFVVRRAAPDSGKLAQVFQLNAKNAIALVLADQFMLEKRDIVYVTAAPVARWNRIISQLLPTVQPLFLINEINDQFIEND